MMLRIARLSNCFEIVRPFHTYTAVRPCSNNAIRLGDYPVEMNPEGIPSLSPGLRGTSYPGFDPSNVRYPEKGLRQISTVPPTKPKPEALGHFQVSLRESHNLRYP